jgi:3-(3-hydroxy-phenyl)propionate hydroxylase
MPPFLGQGMCAGIRDAANLAWKLDLVRSGLAGDALFDTYQPERAPHVRTIIERAVAAGQIIQTTDQAVADRRDQMFRSAGQTSIAIGEGGPIDSRMPALATGIFQQPLAGPAGQLFPQSPVITADGGERLLDEILGPAFAVVAGETALPWLQGAANTRDGLTPRLVCVLPPGSSPSACHITTVADTTGLVSTWLAQHGAALVRPDRYVYGVANSAQALSSLTDSLQCQLRP